MVINKKIPRAFRAEKSRYIGLLLLIILSCLSFTALQLVAPSTIDSLHSFWQEGNVEDAHFTLHQPIPDIDAVERQFNLQLEEIRHHEVNHGNASIRVFQETQKINKHAIVSGRDLEQPGEILIDRLFADNNSLSMGDTIQVAGRDYTIVGLVTKPDYIYTLKNHTDILPGTFGIGVLSSQDFANLPRYQSSYSVVFNQDNAEEFRSHLNETNTIMSWLDREDNPRISAVEPDIRAKETIGSFLPSFVLVVTCLIIAVVLWRLLKTEFVQIGTLYALGYKKSDILKHYMVYPLVLCILGGILGALLGIRLAVPIIMATDGFQYNLPVISLTLRPVIIALSLILPCVFLLPTTWYVVGKALKLSPLELMRGAGSQSKVTWLEKRLRLNRFNFNAKFRIRELVRNIPRAIALCLGITFASSLLLIGFIMSDSIKDVVDTGYDDLYRYEYQYTFKSLQFDQPAGERMAVAPASANGDQEEVAFSVYGVEPDGQLLNITNARGTKISDKISVSRPLADSLNIQPGDTITLGSRINNLETQITIHEIADTYMGFFLYMPLDTFNEIFGMPQGSYSILLSSTPLNLDTDIVGSVITSEELREGFEVLLSMLNGFIAVLGVISVVIGIIIIYILTSLLIEENRYNISLMKVLGYGKKHIFSLILNTNFILVFLGFIISVPFIRMVADVLFEEVTEEMSIGIPVIISPSSIIIGFGIIMVAFWISNLVSRRKVWAISMADSLKNRED